MFCPLINPNVHQVMCVNLEFFVGVSYIQVTLGFNAMV